MRRLPVALAVAAWVLGLPGGAVAGTVTVESTRPADPEHGGDVVVFRAAAGERNVVSAQAELPPGGDYVWRITDTGAVITAGAPCQTVDQHTVLCPARPGRYIDFARFELGDGDDRFRTSSPETSLDLTGTFSADGGPGDDRLTAGSSINLLAGGEGNDVLRATTREANQFDGGPGDDRLFGHAGFDELDGGGGRDELYGRGSEDIMRDGDEPGAADADLFDGGSGGCCLIIPGDRVSYRGRTAPIRADLAAGRGGEAGEADVYVDVESIEGGSGADRLLGDGHKNSFIGRPGRDRLFGRGGDDTLFPGPGGGPVSCGAGSDAVGPPTTRDRLAADCELLEAFPIAYRLATRPTPDLRYTVSCPYADEDSPHAYLRCRGTLRIREAGGRRRLLATGSFPPGRWETRELQLALTPNAQARAVWVTIRLRVQGRVYGERWTRTLRWTTRLRLR
jgi:RTX calcium-binding nonapeptide repeat (4 copies)